MSVISNRPAPIGAEAVESQLANREAEAANTKETADDKGDAKTKGDAKAKTDSAKLGGAKTEVLDGVEKLSPAEALAKLEALMKGTAILADAKVPDRNSASELFARLADAIDPASVPEAADVGESFDHDLATRARAGLLFLPKDAAVHLAALTRATEEPGLQKQMSSLSPEQHKRLDLIKAYQKIAFAMAARAGDAAAAPPTSPLSAQLQTKLAQASPQVAAAYKQFMSTGFDKKAKNVADATAQLEADSDIEIPSPEMVKMEAAAKTMGEVIKLAKQDDAGPSLGVDMANGDIESLIIVVMMKGGQLEDSILRDQMNDMSQVNKQREQLRNIKTKMKTDQARMDSEMRDEYNTGVANGDVHPTITFEQYKSVRKAVWNPNIDNGVGGTQYSGVQLEKPPVLPSWIKTGNIAAAAGPDAQGGEKFGLSFETEAGMRALWAKLPPEKNGGGYEQWLMTLGMKVSPKTKEDAIANLEIAAKTMRTGVPQAAVGPGGTTGVALSSQDIDNKVKPLLDDYLLAAALSGVIPGMDTKAADLKQQLDTLVAGGFADASVQAHYQSVTATEKDKIKNGATDVSSYVQGVVNEWGVSDVHIAGGNNTIFVGTDSGHHMASFTSGGGDYYNDHMSSAGNDFICGMLRPFLDKAGTQIKNADFWKSMGNLQNKLPDLPAGQIAVGGPAQAVQVDPYSDGKTQQDLLKALINKKPGQDGYDSDDDETRRMIQEALGRVPADKRSELDKDLGYALEDIAEKTKHDSVGKNHTGAVENLKYQMEAWAKSMDPKDAAAMTAYVQLRMAETYKDLSWTKDAPNAPMRATSWLLQTGAAGSGDRNKFADHGYANTDSYWNAQDMSAWRDGIYSALTGTFGFDPTGKAAAPTQGGSTALDLGDNISKTDDYIQQLKSGSGTYFDWFASKDFSGDRAKKQKEDDAKKIAAAQTSANKNTELLGFSHTGSLDEFSAFAQQIDDKMASLSELSETGSMRLQMSMQRRAKFYETLSNMMQKLDSTSKTIRENTK